MEEEGETSAELVAQRSQKELDDEIKKRKERQVGIDVCKDILSRQVYFQKFHDDIGVFVSMVTITLIAVVVVTIKVILFYQEVTYCRSIIYSVKSVLAEFQIPLSI